jgi:hypothetical protein
MLRRRGREDGGEGWRRGREPCDHHGEPRTRQRDRRAKGELVRYQVWEPSRETEEQGAEVDSPSPRMAAQYQCEARHGHEALCFLNEEGYVFHVRDGDVVRAFHLEVEVTFDATEMAL